MRSTQQIKNFPIHAYTARHIQNKGVSRPDGFPDWQLIYTYSGSGAVLENGSDTCEITAGDVMLIRPGVSHEYRQKGSEPWMITYITFGGQAITDGLMDSLSLNGALTVYKSAKFPDQTLLKELFDLARTEYAEHSYADDLITNSVLYKIILQCRLNLFPPESIKRPAPEIAEAVRYMTSHLGENISASQLASAANISVFSLYKRFKQAFSLTPWEYLTLLRLDKARSMLISETDMTLREIGHITGLGAAGLFRHFKNRFGLTPGEFREKNKSIFVPDKNALPISVSEAIEVFDHTDEQWQEARRENCWQLMFFSDGEGELIDGSGEIFPVRPGDICLIFPEADCRICPVRSPWTVSKISFGGKYVRQLLKSLGFDEINLIHGGFSFLMKHNFSPDLRYDFQSVFDKICSSSWETSFSAAMESSVLLYELLMYSAVLAEYCSAVTSDDDALAPAIDYIRANYAKKLALSDIAAEAGLSENTLNRLFKNVYKKNPWEFILSERLNRAKRLLIKHGNMSVTEIARFTGFSGASHFIAAFKEREGLTPDEYRDLYFG